MEFGVEYSVEALLQLKRLDKDAARRIMQKVDSARSDPRHYFKGLTGRPEKKLRVGEYRAIALVDEGKRTIFIISVGHRRDVYKKH